MYYRESGLEKLDITTLKRLRGRAIRDAIFFENKGQWKYVREFLYEVADIEDELSERGAEPKRRYTDPSW